MTTPSTSPPVRVSVPREPLTIALALVGIGASTVAAGLAWSPERTWPTLLVSTLYLLTMAVSGAVVVCIHYLSGAGWSAVLRRIPEAMMSALPVVAVLMLMLFFGRQALYPWATPEVLSEAPLPPAKSIYLSTPFVFLRMALVLASWVWFARAMRTASLRQDADPDPTHHQRLVRYSAAFAVAFSVTFALGSVDWLMSLDPRWSSTLFAIYLFAGVLASGLAAVTLIVLLLSALGPLRAIVRPAHLHDLGTLLFAFSTFWAYIWFCQYLLIWYSNLPEEVTHYVRRTDPAWAGLFFLNLGLNWGVPFVALLARSAKRNARVLAGVCVALLVGHWLDLYLLVMPELFERPALGPLEVVIPLGYTALFFVLTFRALMQASLVPVHDPQLVESLNHHT
jgi:hypothetical protein